MVYRLVSSAPPGEADFASLRALRPRRKVADECMARGLSVFEKPDDARRMRFLPALREKSICKVVLGAGSGKIKQTGQPSHHTLWPYASYPLLDRSEVLPE